MIGTRAVGFCMNPRCQSFARAIRVESCGGRYACRLCRAPGRVVHEQTSQTRGDDLYDSVRVEYAYDPQEDAYAAVEVVREPGLLADHNVYTLRSPLITRPETARRLAAIVLGNLNRAHRRSVPRYTRPTRDDLLAEGWKTVA